MALLLLLAIIVLPALLEAFMGAVACVFAAITLLIAVLASFALLPWYLALAAWGLLGGLVVFESRRNARLLAQSAATDRARIRELERLADNLRLPFDTRAELRRQAFDLRCRLQDWDGFP